ncbi:MAG: GNAT family N-acetyltransferase [Pseudomonadota bacterium]
MGERILRTERLTLSYLSPADAPFILELVNDPDWLRFIGDKAIHSIEDAEDYIRTGPMSMYEVGGLGMLRVARASDNDVIGVCGLVDREGLDDIDIGFALLPSYRQRGYAREAALAVLADAFQSPRLGQVAAIALPHNLPSITLLTSIGFRHSESIRLPGEKDVLSLFMLSREQFLSMRTEQPSKS